MGSAASESRPRRLPGVRIAPYARLTESALNRKTLVGRGLGAPLGGILASAAQRDKAKSSALRGPVIRRCGGSGFRRRIAFGSKIALALLEGLIGQLSQLGGEEHRQLAHEAVRRGQEL